MKTCVGCFIVCIACLILTNPVDAQARGIAAAPPSDEATAASSADHSSLIRVAVALLGVVLLLVADYLVHGYLDRASVAECAALAAVRGNPLEVPSRQPGLEQ
jgi:hypothetical protein